MAGQLYGASESTAPGDIGHPARSEPPVSRLFAADPVTYLGAPDLDSEGNRSLGQQVLDIMRGTFIARQEHMRSIVEQGYIMPLSASEDQSFPSNLRPEMLNKQGSRWYGFIVQRDKDWEFFEGHVQEVIRNNYNIESLKKLLNRTPWGQFAMHKNGMLFEAECSELLALFPNMSHIYKNDADILRYALSLLLPLMSENKEYQEDFQDWSMDALPTKGLTSLKPSVTRNRDRVEIITSMGTVLGFTEPVLK